HMYDSRQPRAHESFPTRRSSDLARAMFLLDEGKFELAARHALVCMEAAPLDHRAFLVAAIANESLGRKAVAERLYRRTLAVGPGDRKSTRLNSSHVKISYAVFCL